MDIMKKLKKYEDLYITIDDYFHMYYNFNKGTFVDMTHSNVENMFPFVSFLDWNDVSREDILAGDVLLVKDSNNYIIAYGNPFAKEREFERDTHINSPFLEELDSYLEDCKDNSKVSVIFTVEDDIDEDFDVDSMNKYELAKKKKELIFSHNYRMARLVQKELYFRSKRDHGTKKDKIRKLIKKESMEE